MTLPPMKLLALELSTEACSVALWVDGEVSERFEVAPRRHAELALPWAGQLLADAGIARSQLDAIAIGRGPGAFTGVRLAIAIGQGIALALGRPMVAVSTLATLALSAGGPRVLAAIDARMGEVYSAAFELRDGDAARLQTAHLPRRPPTARPSRLRSTVPAPAASSGAISYGRFWRKERLHVLDAPGFRQGR